MGSKTINLKQGFNINLRGKAEEALLGSVHPLTYALKPTDFNHFTIAKMMVKEGDNVKAGTPLFYEKTMEGVYYCAPVSGEVVEVIRGEKRRVLEVRILADREVEYENFQVFSSVELNKLSREEIKEYMAKAGVWPNIIQRPFGCVADPKETPKSIFISAFDTHPLAPNYSYLLKGQESYFQRGIELLSKLTEGVIHLNTAVNEEMPTTFIAKRDLMQNNKFSGVHPVGNVGIQIHHIDPIKKGEIVWTLNPYGVLEIGRLFLTGKYDVSKQIALTGSRIKKPAYVSIIKGACVDKILKDNVIEGENRVVSGNVLTGSSIGDKGHLSYYDNQITVIPEGKKEEFLGWASPTFKKLSFHRAFGLLSFLLGKTKAYDLDTNQHGEKRNFVMTGAFEKVLPMDVLPTHLFKAIISGDYDEMEALGIYELIEEDVALCEFIDVSKNDIQKILRQGIDLIKNG